MEKREALHNGENRVVVGLIGSGLLGYTSPIIGKNTSNPTYYEVYVRGLDDAIYDRVSHDRLVQINNTISIIRVVSLPMYFSLLSIGDFESHCLLFTPRGRMVFASEVWNYILKFRELFVTKQLARMFVSSKALIAKAKYLDRRNEKLNKFLEKCKDLISESHERITPETASRFGQLVTRKVSKNDVYVIENLEWDKDTHLNTIIEKVTDNIQYSQVEAKDLIAKATCMAGLPMKILKFVTKKDSSLIFPMVKKYIQSKNDPIEWGIKEVIEEDSLPKQISDAERFVQLASNQIAPLMSSLSMRPSINILRHVSRELCIPTLKREISCYEEENRNKVLEYGGMEQIDASD